MRDAVTRHVGGSFFGISLALVLAVSPAAATPFHFSTGNPDGKMATATRPESGDTFEIESADDFILPTDTSITHATFRGLLPSGSPLSNITQVIVEIYRVFPKDSDTTRTINVPTRSNSPSDIAFTGTDSAAGSLTFEASIDGSFTAANSVQPGGIHPGPNQTTGGNGPVTGQAVAFDVTFTPPIVLPADHYFFIPQVVLTSGQFFWLSAPKPIGAEGTPFSMDLQSWTRDANLDPDWLRVGTDIVGGDAPPAFNAAFSLDGVEVFPFHFSTGDPDGNMATATRPASDGSFEIEAGDDFVLAGQASITHATFTGLLPSGSAVSDISDLVVEIYRVFPNDSDTTRQIKVPVRTNSPADEVFTSADSAAGTVSFFEVTVVAGSFTAANSVQPGGIHAAPDQTTHGDGPVTGQEVMLDVTFSPPIVLPADHYFFIPQVTVTSGNFLWLSAPKPIGSSGTPFTGDLQSWTRDANLDPDWLRVGTDIVGGSPAPTFNAAFSLDGNQAFSCIGDCSGDGTVTIDDLITMVNIALDEAELKTCVVGDANRDGAITVEEIITAVSNALNSCPGT